MARALEDEFYDPVPGYDPRKLRPMPAPADVPRGGMPVPGPLGPVPSFPEEPRETYADPDSLTRSQRYGFGDERDLSVPVVDPRDQYAPSPSSWGGVVQRGSGRAAFDGRGGYAYTAAPAVPDLASPRVPFADAAGESLAATAARGARMQAEQDRLGLTTADMDYIRSYGRAAWEERNAKYGAPSSREDYLRRQQGNLAVSVAERRAAGRELADIERENAERRRREEWALAQAQNLRLAEGGWKNAVDVQNAKNAGLVAQAMAEGQARVDAAKAQGASAEQVAATQAEADKAVAAAKAQAELDMAREFPWAPGGGNSSVNRATGDIKTAEGAELDPDDPKNWKKIGQDLYNVRTKQYVTAQNAARELDKRIAALQDKLAAGNAILNPQALRDQIAELEARKRELGLDAQAPEAPEPAPASEQPAAPAPAAPAAPEASTPAAFRTPSSVSAESVMPVNSKFKGSALSLGTDGYLRVTMPDGSSFRPVYKTNRAGHLWLAHPDTGDAIFGGPIFGSAGPDEQKLVEALKDFYALPREKQRADSIEWKRVQLASQAMMKAGRAAERPSAPAQPAAPSSPTGRRRFEG